MEIDLSNPTLMVYESSKFLGENLVTNIRRPIVYCATLIRYMYFKYPIISNETMMVIVQDWGKVRQQECLGKSLVTAL